LARGGSDASYLKLLLRATCPRLIFIGDPLWSLFVFGDLWGEVVNIVSGTMVIVLDMEFRPVMFPGGATHLLFQARQAVRLVWGANDAAYYSYGRMERPTMLPAGFRARAEAGTATIVVTALNIR